MMSEQLEALNRQKPEVTTASKNKRSNWHILVPLREKHRHSQPFSKKLPSRNIIAIMLSYVGTKPKVCRLLQLINHSSRAYIVQ